MVDDGAVILGDKPIDSPSLTDDQTEFKKMTDQLWVNTKGENKVGKGRVFSGMTLSEVLSILQIKPDFEPGNQKDSPDLLFVHRKLPETDIYWVDNRRDCVINLDAIFRVTGKSSEIWHPETGKTELGSYSIKEGRTKVQLLMKPYDAVFIVFNKKTTTANFTSPQKTEKLLTTLSGDWSLKFQSDRGAPSGVTFSTLSSWSNNKDEGIKYFSGTASYSKTVQAPENWFKSGNQLWIDLGDVKNLAEILINGKSLGIVWRKPFRLDVTEEMKPGSNNLKIRVTNLWVNRLIGDQQPGIKTKYTYTTQAFYQANSQLLSSGLLGPVQIMSISAK